MKTKIYLFSALIILAMSFTSCKKDELTEPSKEVKVTEPITVVAVITDVSNNQESNGEIFLEVTGGDAPYTYKWEKKDWFCEYYESLPIEGNRATGLSEFTYRVTITDVTGLNRITQNYIVSAPKTDYKTECIATYKLNGIELKDTIKGLELKNVTQKEIVWATKKLEGKIITGYMERLITINNLTCFELTN